TLGQFPGLEGKQPPVLRRRPDREVLLAALPAEGEVEEQLVPVAGLELLPVQGDVPDPRRLQGSVDVPGPADELVQPESEEALALAILHVVRHQEEIPEVLAALVHGQT